jgi:hypothetical protein
MLHDILVALSGYLSHVSDTDLVAIAAVLASVVQFFVVRVRELSRLENYLLSLPLPFITAFLVFFPQGQFTFAKGSFAYLGAQVFYLTITEIARRAKGQAVTTSGYVSVDNGVPTGASTTGTNF